jgi:hypothetical protein
MTIESLASLTRDARTIAENGGPPQASVPEPPPPPDSIEPGAEGFERLSGGRQVQLRRRAERLAQHRQAQAEKRALRTVILGILGEERCWADHRIAAAALAQVCRHMEAEANDFNASVRADQRDDDARVSSAAATARPSTIGGAR